MSGFAANPGTLNCSTRTADLIKGGRIESGLGGIAGTGSAVMILSGAA
jgi:hypothetical protein